MNGKLFSGAAVGAVAAAALIGATGRWPSVAANAVTPASPPPAAAGLASFADIVEKVSPAVVSINVESKAGPRPTALRPEGRRSPFGYGGREEREDFNPFGFDFRQAFPGMPDVAPLPRQGAGSGFFVSADGYIVTNNHVIDDAVKITVKTHDGRELPAKIVGADPATDLAVIKVAGDAFPFVSFEDRGKPRVGDWVIAVGNPFNLGGTATAGIVSALSRQNVSGSSYVDYMQIDAPINRGNSGGPTFDVYGRVVGVNSAIFSPSGGSVGIGFDIPADVAASVTRQLISNGKVTRGYIGATVQAVTPEIAESLGLSDGKGALIAELTPGGPSALAGLRQGDLVDSINGRKVESAADLTRQVAQAKQGDPIRLRVRRDNQYRDVVVRSGVRPPESELRQAG